MLFKIIVGNFFVMLLLVSLGPFHSKREHRCGGCSRAQCCVNADMFHHMDDLNVAFCQGRASSSKHILGVHHSWSPSSRKVDVFLQNNMVIRVLSVRVGFGKLFEIFCPPLHFICFLG